jgi:methylation protein EvaC
MYECRVCAGPVRSHLDFGDQPLSDAFLRPDQVDDEFSYRLELGRCEKCTMVQLVREVPRDRMFHQDYPYRSSLSVVMREHFEAVARRFLATELTRRPDPFVVEIGCNDGVMLRTVAAAGVRHLGVEPSGGVADLARAEGVQVRTDFFEKRTAAEVRAEHGPADVIYAANTMCHIPYLESILAGVDQLLTPDGVLVFEDPYLGDILEISSFDQVYDEHFYLFSAGSVAGAAALHGFELVDVERLPVHGGEVRYTLARAGARTPAPAVAALLAEEDANGVNTAAALDRFGDAVRGIRTDLLALLRRLKDEGARVVGYGATAKSATVTNFCGIGPDLVAGIHDTTPAKVGLLSPGAHIPVIPAAEFAAPYPDYAVLFAWNHATEIIARETGFAAAGGKWIRYVPSVGVV